MSFTGSDAPNVAAWSDVELVAAITGGARNPIFRARRGNEDLVVRASGRSPDSLDWELQLLQTLSGAGVVVPLPILTDDGRPSADGVLIHRFIAGQPPRDHQDWRRVVDVLRTVHDVTVGWRQRPGFASAHRLLTEDRGGDVDMTAIPESDRALIRRAWVPVLDGAPCAIHGDMGAGNVLVSEDHIALIDWDEARVDVPAFDYAHLPHDVPVPMAVDRRVLITAGVAWEAATCWVVEPEYARRRLVELQDLMGDHGALR